MSLLLGYYTKKYGNDMDHAFIHLVRGTDKQHEDVILI